MTRLAYYRDTLQFDRTVHVPFTRQYRILCSSCAALVINGVPCHESGCPQDTQECAGCNARVPARQRYCGDCQ
jgi:hypothetical protein